MSRHPSPPRSDCGHLRKVTSLCCSVAACDSGHWGPDCSYACNCSAGHGGCDAVSGLCVCEAGYVGPRCEERESQPGPHTHVHMHAHVLTHTQAHVHTYTHTCTSVRGTQPCSLSPDKQGSPRLSPPATSPIWLPCHPPPSYLPGLKRRPTWSKGSKRWGQWHPKGRLPPVRGEESVC